MKAFIVIVVLLSTPAAAQTMIYRCKGPKGQVELSQHGCPYGYKQVSQKVYAPVRYDSGLAAQTERTNRIVSQRNAQATAPVYEATVPRYTASDHARARCAEAKRSRDSTLKAVGLNRNFNLLRRLDNMVYEACK